MNGIAIHRRIDTAYCFLKSPVGQFVNIFEFSFIIYDFVLFRHYIQSGLTAKQNEPFIACLVVKFPGSEDNGKTSLVKMIYMIRLQIYSKTCINQTTSVI